AFARRSIRQHNETVPRLRAGGKPVPTFRDHALLLVVLAGAEAKADAVAVAVMAPIDALVGHAALLVGRIVGVAAADLASVRLPDAVDDESGTGKNRGSIRQMHRAQRFARERAGLRRAAERDADELAAKLVHGHRLGAGRNDRGGERRQNKIE